MAIIKTIDSISFENDVNEFLDITYHVEGYIDIKVDLSVSFSIVNESEIDEICNAMKELLRQSKRKKRKNGK
jgi:hypothetical protein